MALFVYLLKRTEDLRRRKTVFTGEQCIIGKLQLNHPFQVTLVSEVNIAKRLKRGDCLEHNSTSLICKRKDLRPPEVKENYSKIYNVGFVRAT